MKKRVVFLTMIVVGALLLWRILVFTTFEKAVADQLNEDTVIESITISLYQFPEGYQERKAVTTIEDEELIRIILEDFSDLKLKKIERPKNINMKYSLSIITTNEVAENHLSTEKLYLRFDENFITISNGYYQHFEIVNDTDHLKTIKSLIENEKIEWENY